MDFLKSGAPMIRSYSVNNYLNYIAPFIGTLELIKIINKNN